MSSRRKHSKSRHGCTQCKAAHIKCDLAQPTCGKCTRTNKSCQFPNLVNAGPSNPPSPSIKDHHNPPGISSLLSATPSPAGATIVPELPCSSQVGIVSWDDLELLHHFVTVTFATMASRDDLRQMYQIQIPKMALKQKFLMHSIFSVTALHMACSHPEDQSSYIDRALRHYNIALREYSSRLHKMTRENSASMFACASLIVISALNLALSRPHKETMSPIEEMLGIFMLLRGVKLIVRETWDWIREGDIAPMFARREPDDMIIPSDDIANAIKLLEERNQLSSNSESDRDTYTVAIQGVKKCFKLLSSNHQDNGMMLSWPIFVSLEYIALLASRQQMALVILAHYAVILDEIKDTWWVTRWGSKLIQEVGQVASSEWKGLMAWPMSKINIEIHDHNLL